MKANKEYEKKIHKILKTYNSILVKCKNIPLLSDKNIVMVENIAGMINAQIETRKPILYFQEGKCISFMLLDGTECYVYVIKASEEIVSEVEHTINNFEYAKNTFVNEILSKIENVLLSENIDKKNTLAASELKYLESIKKRLQEKRKAQQKKLPDNIETQSGTKNNTSSIKNAKETNEKVSNNSNNLYLVPVKKKKVNFFSRNFKIKRANS